MATTTMKKIYFLDAFWSCCRRGVSVILCRPQQRHNNVFFVFLAGAVIALIGSTLANLYLYSSAAATSSRGSIYADVPKQAQATVKEASVDFPGEIVTKPDEACLDQQHQTQTNTTTETAVICAIAKYEENYLDEWVDYHLSLGFAHIFIYDNTVDFELKEWAKSKSCRVSVKHFPGSAPQPMAYLNCARDLPSGRGSPQNQHQQQDHTWIAFFDIDEFLILIDPKYQNISSDDDHDTENMQSGGGMVVPFLRDHCPPGVALGINWRIMGTAGHTLYQPAPMTQRFQYATAPIGVANPHVKSIIRRNDLDLDRPSHVHYPLFKRHKNESSDTTTVTPLLQQQRDTSGKVFKGFMNFNKPSNVALLYHYGYKSNNEYRVKRLVRGRAASNEPVPEGLIAEARGGTAPRGSYFDDTAWKTIKRHLPHYAVFDQLFPHYSIPPESSSS